MSFASHAFFSTSGHTLNWGYAAQRARVPYKFDPAHLKLLNIGRDQKPVDSPYDQSYNPPALAANLKIALFEAPLFAAATLSLQQQLKINH